MKPAAEPADRLPEFLRNASHNVLRGTHDPADVAGILALAALELEDARELAAARERNYVAAREMTPGVTVAPPAFAPAGVRHKFGTDGICHATHADAAGECGAVKGKGGRPRKEPAPERVPPGQTVAPGIVEPGYRAPSPALAAAAADKYADGTGGSSGRVRP